MRKKYYHYYITQPLKGGHTVNYEALGKRVRFHRKMRDLTQEELADAIGVSTSFIGHIERGTRKLSVETLVSIADALHVSCDLLLQDSLDQTITRRSAGLDQNKKLLLREIVNLLEADD